MAKSTIFPPKVEQKKLEFGKKNAGLKAGEEINMKGSFVFKNEKLKPADSGLMGGNMYASMIVSNASSNTRFGFDDYLTSKQSQQTGLLNAQNDGIKS